MRSTLGLAAQRSRSRLSSNLGNMFSGAKLICELDGFYRFWDPLNSVTKNIVVYGGSDLVTLMSSMALCCSIGRVDDGLSVGAALTQATTSSLRMLCGATVTWIKAMLDSFGNIGYAPITSRMVRALTGQTPTGYYDGHVMPSFAEHGLRAELPQIASLAGFGSFAQLVQ